MIEIENRVDTAEYDIVEIENRVGIAEDPTVFTMSDGGATYQ